jgi:KipI family sensor histidine kinase inhibitor
MTATYPRLLAAGDAALVVEFGETVDPGLNDAVQRLDAAIRAARLAGVIEATPTYRSVLVSFDPLTVAPQLLGRQLLELASQPGSAAGKAARRWFIPVAFGGEQGWDLEEVGQRTGLGAERVVALHCATEYRVYMLGFSPGYAYLGAPPAELQLPRRETPRLMVPANAIMQGGGQAGISPLAMPSGWHILGRTPIRLFDMRRDPPFLLGQGDRVRFHAIDPDRFAAMEAAAEREIVTPDSEAVA